jgi:hypothetical protein
MDSPLFSPRVLKAAPGAAAAKGRGVFATRDFALGELIEAAPCIELDAAACVQIRPTPIEDYYFRHPDDEKAGLLVLGLASLCNHSDDPSAATDYEHDPAIGWIVVLTALRPIATGEEVTRRYACPPWFTPLG